MRVLGPSSMHAQAESARDARGEDARADEARPRCGFRRCQAALGFNRVCALSFIVRAAARAARASLTTTRTEACRSSRSLSGGRRRSSRSRAPSLREPLSLHREPPPSQQPRRAASQASLEQPSVDLRRRCSTGLQRYLRRQRGIQRREQYASVDRARKRARERKEGERKRSVRARSATRERARAAVKPAALLLRPERRRARLAHLLPLAFAGRDDVCGREG